MRASIYEGGDDSGKRTADATKKTAENTDKIAEKLDRALVARLA